MRSSDLSSTIVKVYADGTLKAVTLSNIDTNQIKGVQLCKTKKGEAVNKERSLDNSIYRTKKMFYDKVHSMNVQWFGTLTIDPNYRYAPDRNDKHAFLAYVRNFLSSCRVRAPDLQYLATLEEHKKGGWHVHIVLGNTEGLTFEDANLTLYNRAVYHLLDWKAGFTDFSKTDDPQKAANYMLKYVTKELCTNFQEHRYIASRNIPKCEKQVFQFDDKQNYFNSDLTGLPVRLDPENNIDEFITDMFGCYKHMHEKKTEIESDFNFNLELQTNYYKKVED